MLSMKPRQRANVDVGHAVAIGEAERFLACEMVCHALQAPAGPFTVLAPNDGAFSTFAGKYTDKASLTTILTQHVIVGRFYAADLKNGQVLNTLAGQTLKVSIIDGTVKFTSSSGSFATVLFADVDSSNA